MNKANSITCKAVYNKIKDEYNTLYSKRGIQADYEEIANRPIASLFNKVWRQDDWGLVTIWTSYKDNAARFVVLRTNLGYDVRAWVNNCPCHELDGRLNALQSISELIA